MTAYTKHAQVQNMHKFKPEKIPTMKEGKWAQAPPLAKKLFVIDSLWERESQFSSMK